jgi:hypothetical protein
VSEQLKAMDKALAEQATTHEVAKRSCTAVGVGPATAISFVATIDRLGRFDKDSLRKRSRPHIPAIHRVSRESIY